MPDLIDAVARIVGPSGVLAGPDAEPYYEDWRKLYQGRAQAVVRPADTGQVSDVVRLCAETGTPVVPQGGNTSMVGGATPDETGRAIVLSLTRMNRVRDIDATDLTITLDAGVTLKAAQMVAAEAGCLLPLSISSEGSAEIGGILATNAGGNNTVRYGNARDLLLGLEVVLPDGAVWNGLRRLRKDNTGYCLRQIFAGSEGTLGIITAAVMKLAPRLLETVVAFCSVRGPEDALALFSRFQTHDPGAIQAFEYMSGLGTSFVLRHIPGAVLPVAEQAAGYVLVELATSRVGAGLRASMEEVLGVALEAGVISDAAIAESEAQRAAIWRLREEHSEAQKREGASIKNDVSVPVSKVPDFIREATEACEQLIPGVRVVPFGHIGDGNIHFNLEQPEGVEASTFLAQDHAVMDAVNDVVRRFDGSFSAEHGVGRLKPYLMPEWRGGVELDLMRRLKAAFDPRRIMNPGKVLPM